MSKKADATRERILEAATAEFAEYGIAGARVDRIAAASAGNKRLIYLYYGSKEGLFEAVLKRHLLRVTEEVEFTPDDLTRYAAAYFDFAMANPKLMRLIGWWGLESKGMVVTELATIRKLGLIAEAQMGGTISKRFSPTFILSTIALLASAWVPSNWFGASIDPEAIQRLERYRDQIVRLVALMIESEEG